MKNFILFNIETNTTLIKFFILMYLLTIQNKKITILITFTITHLIYNLITYYIQNKIINIKYLYNLLFDITENLNNLFFLIHPILILISFNLYKLIMIKMIEINYKKNLFYKYNSFLIKSNIKIYRLLITIFIISLSMGIIWALQELNWTSWWSWDNIEKTLLLIFILNTSIHHFFISLTKPIINNKTITLLLIFFFNINLLILLTFLFDTQDSQHTFLNINLEYNYYYNIILILIFYLLIIKVTTITNLIYFIFMTILIFLQHKYLLKFLILKFLIIYLYINFKNKNHNTLIINIFNYIFLFLIYFKWKNNSKKIILTHIFYVLIFIKYYNIYNILNYTKNININSLNYQFYDYKYIIFFSLNENFNTLQNIFLLTFNDNLYYDLEYIHVIKNILIFNIIQFNISFNFYENINIITFNIFDNKLIYLLYAIMNII